MANDKKYKRLDLTKAVDPFKNNRVNKITYSSINSYIDVNASNTYACAWDSSPTLSSTDDMGGVQCVTRTNGVTYVIYKNYSYTYTEGVDFGNCGIAFIAYDFINKMDNAEITLNGYIEHICYGDYTVNEKSYTSYTITNDANGLSIPLKDSLSLSKSNLTGFTGLLGSSTYMDCSSYINFSYINNEGYIYNDGCRRITDDNVKDFHVWSLSSRSNLGPHDYKANDNKQLNPTVKLNVGQKLKHAIITNGKHVSSYFAYRYNDTNYDTPDIRYNSADNNSCYIQMGNQTFENFYKNAYAYYDGHYTNNTFSYCYTWPATRWNQTSYNFYETVYVKSKINGSYNDNNVNAACHIRRISKLPVGLLYCNSNPGTYLPITSYVYGGTNLINVPNSGNVGPGIDHYTVNFSYKMINPDGTLSNDTHNLAVETGGFESFTFSSNINALYPNPVSFDIITSYFACVKSSTEYKYDDTYYKTSYYPTELYCPSNFLDNKIVTKLTIAAYTHGQYLVPYNSSTGSGSPCHNIPRLDVTCAVDTSFGGALNYNYSQGYVNQNDHSYYYRCEITPSANAVPLSARITSIDINFYIKSNN